MRQLSMRAGKRNATPKAQANTRLPGFCSRTNYCSVSQDGRNACIRPRIHEKRKIKPRSGFYVQPGFPDHRNLLLQLARFEAGMQALDDQNCAPFYRRRRTFRGQVKEFLIFSNLRHKRTAQGRLTFRLRQPLFSLNRTTVASRSDRELNECFCRSRLRDSAARCCSAFGRFGCGVYCNERRACIVRFDGSLHGSECAGQSPDHHSE